MNDIFTIDQLHPIWEKSMKHVVKDRLRYSYLYELIEDYISQHISEKRLILGGTTGIDMLLGKDRSIEDYSYELYTEDSFYHANELVNNIAKSISENDTDSIPPKITMLRTAIPYHKYNLVADNRILVVIYDLGKNKGASTIDIIDPVEAETFDKKRKLLVLPPEMHLIDTYRTLYSPNKAGDWESALHDENKLFKLMQSQERTNLNIKGGEVNLSSKDIRQKVQMTIIKKFVVNNPNCVLIGEHAFYTEDLQSEGTGIKSFVVQVISSNSPEDDFKEIGKILTAELGVIPISKHSRIIHIMQDFRLFRTAIKLGDEKSGESKEAIYIYNSAKYDLIPFNRFLYKEKSKVDFIQIGNPFVLMRFLLIDFWIIRWIFASGGINENYSQLRLNAIKEKILLLRSKLSESKDITTISDNCILGDSSMRIFQENTEDYLGYYENEEISQKEKAKDVTKKYYDYYPQEYFNRNSEYRSISN